MADYKEMYLTMARETEKAVRLMEESLQFLIAAQQNCEEMYINAPEPVIQLLEKAPGSGETEKEAGAGPHMEAEN